MKNIEVAKELLKKAIALNDEELIALANRLLDDNIFQNNNASNQAENKNKTSKRQTKKATKSPPKKNSKVESNDFTMNKRVTKQTKIPVNKIKNRKNIFFDDRTEATEIETPVVKPTNRDRPKYKPTYKKCSNDNCNKKVKVVAGDGYVGSYLCDDCILGRKGR